jgi:CRP-like cAMP-binding protein
MVVESVDSRPNAAQLTACSAGKIVLDGKREDFHFVAVNDSELYVIAKGAASVRLRMADKDRTTRLITIAPGTDFGELALFDQEARSVTVEADEDRLCYVLTHEKFVMLTQCDPAVAIELLTNLSRELASRLRRTTRTIYQLAS